MRRPPLAPLAVHLAIVTVLALLAAGPVFAAYVIYLKDGSHVIAREKYTLEGPRAIITLENGTQTFIQASDIDVRRTEQYNKQYGGAVVIPGQPQKVGPETGAPRGRTLADLIKSREAAPRDLPANRRDKDEATPGRLVKTKAGFDDLTTLPRKSYGRLEVSTELQQFFRGQGFESVEISEGTRPDRPLIELTTPSEGSVLKALATAANALLHIRDRHPQRIAAFEILLTTPERERAGQFLLTPEAATDLVAKKVDATAFFVQNVQF